jgi:hypothetical protein
MRSIGVAVTIPPAREIFAALLDHWRTNCWPVVFVQRNSREKTICK